MKIRKILICLMVFTLVYGCKDLDTINPNAPDVERALATPEDLQSVLSGGYVSWWWGVGGDLDANSQSRAFTLNSYMHIMGEHMTTTNAFADLVSFAFEPRTTFNNSVSNNAVNGELNEVYIHLNSAVFSANAVINATEGIEILDNNGDDQVPSLRAFSFLLRGLAQGYLANSFDQAFIIDENTDLTQSQEFQPYTAVMAAAEDSYEQAISIAESNSFGASELILGYPMDSDELIRFANSHLARQLVCNARTAAENMTTDWAKIETLTRAGIEADVQVDYDGNVWFNRLQQLSNLFWFAHTDHRVIKMMSNDPDYPATYPVTATDPLDPTTSDDARLGTDYVYQPDFSFFRPDRGVYNFSTYNTARYEDQIDLNTTVGRGDYFLVAENDLMLAEALAMQGDAAGARDIINAGTYVTRGGLDPIDATDDVMEIIDYERTVELNRSGMGLPFFDLRRRDALLRGTITQFPIPANELEILQLPVYTFGGLSNAGEPGTSSGANYYAPSNPRQ